MRISEPCEEGKRRKEQGRLPEGPATLLASSRQVRGYEFFRSAPADGTAAAESAMLGHVLLNDQDDPRPMSRTTEEYYLTAQHMDLKALAMKMWSEALLTAYAEAGGTLPMPHENDPEEPAGLDWVLPKLPSRSRGPNPLSGLPVWQDTSPGPIQRRTKCSPTGLPVTSRSTRWCRHSGAHRPPDH